MKCLERLLKGLNKKFNYKILYNLKMSKMKPELEVIVKL